MNSSELNTLKSHVEIEESQAIAISLGEFLSMDLPPRENILEPWLPESGVCMIYAKRGVGKTFFSLEIAMAVAYGTSFLSFLNQLKYFISMEKCRQIQC